MQLAQIEDILDPLFEELAWLVGGQDAPEFYSLAGPFVERFED